MTKQFLYGLFMGKNMFIFSTRCFSMIYSAASFAVVTWWTLLNFTCFIVVALNEQVYSNTELSMFCVCCFQLLHTDFVVVTVVVFVS